VDPVVRVRDLVEPLLTEQGTELFDIELKQGVLRIALDRPGGVDLEVITNATRVINEVLDRVDPIEGRYSLEVSSPGLERPLRTPEHFRRYVGTTITVKTLPDVDGERRIQGVLDGADDEGIAIAGRRVAYADIERARTVFEWGGQPKKGAPKPKEKPKEKKAAS
jgi:ribosome maturation factor RimP